MSEYGHARVHGSGIGDQRAAHDLVSLNSRLEGNKEEDKDEGRGISHMTLGLSLR